MCQDFAVENEKVLGLLNGLIHYLYHKDVLDEDVILRWFNIQLGDLEHEDDLRNHEQVREKVSLLCNILPLHIRVGSSIWYFRMRHTPALPSLLL